MKLEKIIFHAYKSLVNLEINLDKSCIGIVGINESGKSNILKAINTLDENFTLTEFDAPKMADVNPHISYLFSLTPDEKNRIEERIKIWCAENTIEFELKFNSKISVEYNVEFDRENNEEKRYIKLLGIEKNENYYFLKEEYHEDDYKIFYNNEFISLEKALVIPKKVLLSESKNTELNSQLDEIIEKINDFNEEIEESDDESLFKF